MKKINASIDNSAPAFHLEKRSPRGNNQGKIL